jgi:hypothetical protein
MSYFRAFAIGNLDDVNDLNKFLEDSKYEIEDVSKLDDGLILVIYQK